MNEETRTKLRQLLDDTMSGGCDRVFVLKQFDEIADEDLNYSYEDTECYGT